MIGTGVPLALHSRVCSLPGITDIGPVSGFTNTGLTISTSKQHEIISLSAKHGNKGDVYGSLIGLTGFLPAKYTMTSWTKRRPTRGSDSHSYIASSIILSICTVNI